MRPFDDGVSGSEFGRLEHLLSEAADWEPDAPAPEGLAGRVLAYELERQDRERTLRGRERRAGLFAAFFMGASAVSATVALAFFHLTPRSPGAHPTGMARQKPVEIATVVPTQVEPSVPRVNRPDGIARHADTRRPRRMAGTAAPRRQVRLQAAEVPTAVWRDETVHHEVAGVLSSGWLIRQNPEDGSLIITPGVLDLQSTQDACTEPTTPAETNPAGEAPTPPMPEAATPGQPDPEILNAPDAAPRFENESGAAAAPES